MMGLALFLLSLALCVAASPAQASLPRGVDPARAPEFRGRTFTCRDGSKTLPIERVNDGYCDCFLGMGEGCEWCWEDHSLACTLLQLTSQFFRLFSLSLCADGSDEPGTSGEADYTVQLATLHHFMHCIHLHYSYWTQYVLHERLRKRMHYTCLGVVGKPREWQVKFLALKLKGTFE